MKDVERNLPKNEQQGNGKKLKQEWGEERSLVQQKQ